MRHYILAISLFSFWLILQNDQRNTFHRVSSVESEYQLTAPPAHSTKQPKSKRSLTTIDEPCAVNRETLMILYGLELGKLKKLKERPHSEPAVVIPVNFRERKLA